MGRWRDEEMWGLGAKRMERKLFRTYRGINVLHQKTFYFDCQFGSGPMLVGATLRGDPHRGTGESGISELNSRFLGNDGFVINVKESWTHYIKCLPDGA
jgi:hypothetical protein